MKKSLKISGAGLFVVLTFAFVFASLISNRTCVVEMVGDGKGVEVQKMLSVNHKIENYYIYQSKKNPLIFKIKPRFVSFDDSLGRSACIKWLLDISLKDNGNYSWYVINDGTILDLYRFRDCQFELMEIERD